MNEVLNAFSLKFSAEYLRAALIVSLLSVWVLVGLFYYLNRYTKREYFTLWTAAWLFYALWLTLALRLGVYGSEVQGTGISPGQVAFLSMQFCVAISSVFLLWGSLRFLDLPVPQSLFGLFMLFLLIWTYIGKQLVISDLQIQLPVFILLGLAVSSPESASSACDATCPSWEPACSLSDSLCGVSTFRPGRCRKRTAN
jgi:hypothetical protein